MNESRKMILIHYSRLRFGTTSSIILLFFCRVRYCVIVCVPESCKSDEQSHLLHRNPFCRGRPSARQPARLLNRINQINNEVLRKPENKIIYFRYSTVLYVDVWRKDLIMSNYIKFK